MDVTFIVLNINMLKYIQLQKQQNTDPAIAECWRFWLKWQMFTAFPKCDLSLPLKFAP